MSKLISLEKAIEIMENSNECIKGDMIDILESVLSEEDRELFLEKSLKDSIKEHESYLTLFYNHFFKLLCTYPTFSINHWCDELIDIYINTKETYEEIKFPYSYEYDFEKIISNAKSDVKIDFIDRHLKKHEKVSSSAYDFIDRVYNTALDSKCFDVKNFVLNVDEFSNYLLNNCEESAANSIKMRLEKSINNKIRGNKNEKRNKRNRR